MNLDLGDTRLIINECKKQGLLRNQAAYVLATAYHESGHTMKPVREYGGEAYLKTKKYYPYVGMGYVQLTWDYNYKDWSKRLNVDFMTNPKLLLKPEYAVEILVLGSKLGTFTKKKLSDFMTLSGSDYFNARSIINGDKNLVKNKIKIGDLIAGYARAYEKDLLAIGYGVEATEKPVQTIPVPPKVSIPENTNLSVTPSVAPVSALAKFIQFLFSLFPKKGK
jgi:Chitinase class I.